MLNLRSWSALALSGALAACGGGDGTLGDVVVPPPAAKTAEGVYAGGLTGSATNNSFEILVLDGGEYWLPYGVTNTSGVFLLTGFIQGNGTSNNGNFSSTNGLDFGASPPLATTVSATYVAGTSAQGTITSGGSSVGFSGTAAATAPYVYNTPASLAAIVGAWSMTSLAGNAVSVTIGSNGNFTANEAGCISTGTVLPRPSGKNVFDVLASAGASPCSVPGQLGHGVATYSPIVGTSLNQLLVGVVSNDRSTGTAYVGSR